MKQAMMQLQGMAGKRFSNVYNFQNSYHRKNVSNEQMVIEQIVHANENLLFEEKNKQCHQCR